jgi:DNA-binding response OmpR family regulator
MTKTTSGESVQSAQDAAALPRALRIMVVDDDRDAVLTLTTLLRHEGHEVWAVYRAGDVQLAVKHFDPDVVFLDIGLPDGSGYALAEGIRKEGGYDNERPLLIAITGLYKESSHYSLSKAAGFHHFVTKPFAFDHILSLIAPLTLPQAGR